MIRDCFEGGEDSMGSSTNFRLHSSADRFSVLLEVESESRISDNRIFVLSAVAN